MTQSLALSSSTQNSEKLNQAGFNPPPPPRSYHSSLLTVQWVSALRVSLSYYGKVVNHYGMIILNNS